MGWETETTKINLNDGTTDINIYSGGSLTQ